VFYGILPRRAEVTFYETGHIIQVQKVAMFLTAHMLDMTPHRSPIAPDFDHEGVVIAGRLLHHLALISVRLALV